MYSYMWNITLIFYLIKKKFFFVLSVLHGLQDLSSPTRGGTQAPCSGSLESKPLDHQGIPSLVF